MIKSISGFFLIFGGLWIVFSLVLFAVVVFAFKATDAVIPFGVFGGIGLIFVIIGVLGTVKEKNWARAQAAKVNELNTHGVSTRGKVTFVDKNFAVLYNQKPIFSIIECVFVDQRGQQHFIRKENVDSDLVIRTQIKVGDDIDLIYLPANPENNDLLIQYPYAELQQTHQM